MNTQELSLPIYQYVRSIYKGKGLGLGKIASHARIFESDMNAFIDELELREGLVR